VITELGRDTTREEKTAVTAVALCLPCIAPGSLAVVTDVAVDPADAVRLKSLGICVGRRVQLVKGGDPLVVRVLGARVGLSARLACGVFVQPV
jgi:Fe2+ transport system protein FeoA